MITNKIICAGHLTINGNYLNDLNALGIIEDAANANMVETYD